MNESLAYVQSNGSPPAGAKVYRVDQLDDLDAAVREGQVQRVRFERTADLYHGIWEGDVDLAAWLSRGTKIDFESGGSNDLREIYESWRRWDVARRRRRALAGAVLSAITLAACYVLYATLSGR